jgi:hypothetical protein
MKFSGRSTEPSYDVGSNLLLSTKLQTASQDRHRQTHEKCLHQSKYYGSNIFVKFDITLKLIDCSSVDKRTGLNPRRAGSEHS